MASAARRSTAPSSDSVSLGARAATRRDRSAHPASPIGSVGAAPIAVWKTCSRASVSVASHVDRAVSATRGERLTTWRRAGPARERVPSTSAAWNSPPRTRPTSNVSRTATPAPGAATRRRQRRRGCSVVRDGVAIRRPANAHLPPTAGPAHPVCATATAPPPADAASSTGRMARASAPPPAPKMAPAWRRWASASPVWSWKADPSVCPRAGAARAARFPSDTLVQREARPRVPEAFVSAGPRRTSAPLSAPTTHRVATVATSAAPSTETAGTAARSRRESVEFVCSAAGASAPTARRGALRVWTAIASISEVRSSAPPAAKATRTATDTRRRVAPSSVGRRGRSGRETPPARRYPSAFRREAEASARIAVSVLRRVPSAYVSAARGAMSAPRPAGTATVPPAGRAARASRWMAKRWRSASRGIERSGPPVESALMHVAGRDT